MSSYRHRRYSSHDDTIIREEVAKGAGWAQRLAPKLDRTAISICIRVRRLERRGEITTQAVRRRGNHSWTAYDLSALRYAVRQGQTIPELTKTTGRSPSALYAKLRQLGLHAQTYRPNSIPAWQVRTITELNKIGATRAQMSTETGLSIRTIENLHSRLHLPPARSRLWTQSEINKLILLHAAGRTDRQIASLLDRTRAAVALKRYKLTTKQKREH